MHGEIALLVWHLLPKFYESEAWRVGRSARASLSWVQGGLLGCWFCLSFPSFVAYWTLLDVALLAWVACVGYWWSLHNQQWVLCHKGIMHHIQLPLQPCGTRCFQTIPSSSRCQWKILETCFILDSMLESCHCRQLCSQDHSFDNRYCTLYGTCSTDERFAWSAPQCSDKISCLVRW